jgi:hypothetical protein
VVYGYISSYLAVYAEIYCLAKFIIYIYSFRAYARRGGAGGQQAAMTGLSATSRGAGSEPLNNLNENKIILTSNCW